MVYINSELLKARNLLEFSLLYILQNAEGVKPAELKPAGVWLIFSELLEAADLLEVGLLIVSC